METSHPEDAGRATVSSPRPLLAPSGRIARNTALNFAGQVGPLLIGVFAIPILIKELGIDRFGVLTLVWLVIGYFSLFDLGIGRALTSLVAEKLGAGSTEDTAPLVWTAWLLMILSGVAGAAVLALLSSWLVGSVLKIPPLLHGEALSACYILAPSIPVVIATAGIRGVLEGTQRFGFINAVRLLMGAFSYLAPLGTLVFSESLVPIVTVLTVGRLLALVLHLFFCVRVMPSLRNGIAFKPAMVKPLLRMGGWMTVSNTVSPIMAYADRLVVAAVASTAAVAYYVTPFSIVINFLAVPLALVGVLFPAFAASYGHSRDHAGALFVRGVRYVSFVMVPIALVVVAFGRPVLGFWLGEEFAARGTRVLQILMMGVLANSLAQVPMSLIQSVGRPDLAARLHLLEAPPYLLLVWWMTSSFGIEGTAMVWSLRAAIDAVVLFHIARRLLPKGVFQYRHAEIPGGAISLALALVVTAESALWTPAYVTATTALIFSACWLLLREDESWAATCAAVRRGAIRLQRAICA